MGIMKRFGVLALAVLVFAVLLRSQGLGSQVLWLDEGYSWWDAHQSLESIWSVVPLCDPLPPLYIVLLKGWIALFGDTAVALRGLSTAIGVLTTLVVMLAGREVDRRLAIAAGLVFASMPFQIEFAQEARPYTLVALGAAVLAFGLMRTLTLYTPRADGALPALGDARARAGWVALVGGLLIMLWSNNTSPFTATAVGVVVATLVWRVPAARRLTRPFFYCGLVVALLWLPYLPTLFQQMQGVSRDFWIPRPDWWRFGNELRFVVGLGSFPGLWVMAGLWGLGLWRLRRAHRAMAWTLFALVSIPVLLNFAESRIATPVFLSRALIGIAPFFALGVGAAFLPVPGGRGWQWMAPALASLIGIQILAAFPLYTEGHRKEPWDLIAQDLIESIHQAGVAPEQAVVLVTPNELALPLSHVLSHRYRLKIDIHGVPGDFPDPGQHARYPSGKCAPAVASQAMGNIPHLVADRRTVFFVTREHNVYDPHDDVPALLHEIGLKSVDRHGFSPGSLMVYEYAALPGRLLSTLNQALHSGPH